MATATLLDVATPSPALAVANNGNGGNNLEYTIASNPVNINTTTETVLSQSLSAGLWCIVFVVGSNSGGLTATCISATTNVATNIAPVVTNAIQAAYCYQVSCVFRLGTTTTLYGVVTTNTNTTVNGMFFCTRIG